MNAIVDKLTHRSLLLVAIATLALAGCGGGGDAGGGYGGASDSTAGGAETTAAPNPEEGATFVSVAAVPGLGRVLVDSSGHTLYDFHKDQGAESSCYGGCAAVWPPLLSAGEPHASNGAVPGQLGTSERKDGTTQVTYAGHPLYTYVEDTQPGDAKGHDIESFGAEWYALVPSGAEAED